MHTYTVALAFDMRVTDPDPARLAAAVKRFGELLPEGGQTLAFGAADSEGIATLTARVPATAGSARALYQVASALEMTAERGPDGRDALGELRHATVDFEG